MSLSELLPKKMLEELIASFEAIWDHPGMVAIYDPEGSFYVGSTLEPGSWDELISVSKRPVAQLRLTSGMDNPMITQAATFFAHMLAQLASEASQRQALLDEALQRYQELNLVYDLGVKFVERTSQDDILKFVLDSTRPIVDADAGVVYLLDEYTRQLKPVSFFGNKSETAAYWEGRLLELAKSALYAFDQAQGFDADRVVCAPLRYGEDMLGALVLVHETPGKRFAAGDQQLLTTLSQNVALFIYVTRLVQRLEAEKLQLEQTVAELNATKDKLSHAERLSIIGQTVGSLVHDMRKPLSLVMGYAGLLQEPDLTMDERVQFASQIIKYVEVFSSMAQEVLDYVSGDSGVNKSPITVEQYMASVSDLLNPPGLERDVRVIIDLDDARNLTINVDSQRFTRVFQNLVNNAMDAIETHGGSQIEIKVEPVGGDIRFTIVDDGPGVPEKIVDTLFEPFVTMGKSNGTGLGLAIVERMVAVHGGKIRYEPVPGHGARFVFSIPQYRQAQTESLVMAK